MTPIRIEQILSLLRQPLSSSGNLWMYALVDAARSETIYPEIAAADLKKACLHKGSNAEELAWVAPYLVELGNGDNGFTQWLLKDGWGDSRVVFVTSAADFDRLKRHFRTFLTVYDETGKSYFFRFYDPRVLRAYLPTCRPIELETLFGPVTSYMMEHENPERMLKASYADGSLATESLVLGES